MSPLSANPFSGSISKFSSKSPYFSFIDVEKLLRVRSAFLTFRLVSFPESKSNSILRKCGIKMHQHLEQKGFLWISTKACALKLARSKPNAWPPAPAQISTHSNSATINLV